MPVRDQGMRLLVMLTLCACGGAEPAPADTPPAWTSREHFVQHQGGVRSFVGIGSFKHKNIALAHSSADNRARQAINDDVLLVINELVGAYMKEDPDFMMVGGAIKTLYSATVCMTMVVERWKAPDGTVFSLAHLDLASFYQALDRDHGGGSEPDYLPPRLRAVLRPLVEPTFDRLLAAQK